MFPAYGSTVPTPWQEYPKYPRDPKAEALIYKSYYSESLGKFINKCPHVATWTTWNGVRTEDGQTYYVPDYITQEAFEIMEWLQYCLEMRENGFGDELIPDPLYQRHDGKPPLTEHNIEVVIAGLDAEFNQEMSGGTANTHRAKSGAEDRTEWYLFSPTAQRAIVEGLDRIIHQWEEWYKNEIMQQKEETPKSIYAPCGAYYNGYYEE